MADDHEQENGLMEASSHALNTDTVIVTEAGVQETESEEVTEDILQQAFVEVEEFDQNAVAYAVSDGVDAASVVQEIVNNVVSESNLVTTIAQSSEDSGLYTNAYTAVGTISQDNTITLAENAANSVASVSSSDVQNAQSPDPPVDQTQTVAAQAVSTGYTLVTTTQGNGAPLGSSQNPIRIIQQGNQYTPVQQLTAEQLQQIMQVVQQQQLAKSAQEGGGSSILYNPQTNTRIVYRVIYPSELHKTNSVLQSQGKTTNSQGQQTGIVNNLQKRVYRKRPRDEEDDKVDGPELSKEEKEERKKHRPRTRSGRVSKPPKHMVQDYKHIHVLDWDEDYDDSDGGYSDFKCSDEEAREKRKDQEESPEIFAGLGSTRPKNFKCETCDKAYIGRAGLGRHYRLHPDHGVLPDEPDMEKESDKANGVGSTGSLSEDSNTQDSLPSTGTPSPAITRVIPITTRGRRPGFRGRYAHLQDNTPVKRKAKLREFIRSCEDEELMEVVLPRLANVITLWEFLLMKVEKGGPAKPRVDSIYREFEELHKKVQKVCQEYLRPMSDNDEAATDPHTNKLQLQNENLAHALGLKVGNYEVKEMPTEEDNTFHYKYLTTEPLGTQGKRGNERRTIEIVTPEQLVSQQSNKRPRMTSLLTNTTLSSSETPITVTLPGGGQNISASAGTTNTRIITVNTAPASVAASATSRENSTANPQVLASALPQPPSAPAPSGDDVPTTMAATSESTVLHGALNSEICGAEAEGGIPLDAVAGSNVQVRVIFSHSLSNTTSQGSVSRMVAINGGSNMGPDSIIAASSNSVDEVEPMETTHVQLLDQDSLVATSENSAKSSLDGKTAGEDASEAMEVDPKLVKDLSQDAEDSNMKGEGSVALNGQMNGIAEVIEGDGIINQGEVTTVDPSELITEGQVVSTEGQIIQSSIFQTEDGILIIQNPDGTTFQFQGADGIPLETVQALLAMESEGQLEGEPIQAELQQ